MIETIAEITIALLIVVPLNWFFGCYLPVRSNSKACEKFKQAMIKKYPLNQDIKSIKF